MFSVEQSSLYQVLGLSTPNILNTVSFYVSMIWEGVAAPLSQPSHAQRTLDKSSLRESITCTTDTG